MAKFISENHLVLVLNRDVLREQIIHLKKLLIIHVCTAQLNISKNRYVSERKLGRLTFDLASARPHIGLLFHMVIVGSGGLRLMKGPWKVKSPCTVLIIYTFISGHIHLWSSKAAEGSSNG